MEISFLGPAVFGAALGYVMMNMFVVEEANPRKYEFLQKDYRYSLKPTWQGIGTFIGIALSTFALRAFPEQSETFWSYAFGVGVGTFIREIGRWFQNN